VRSCGHASAHTRRRATRTCAEVEPTPSRCDGSEGFTALKLDAPVISRQLRRSIRVSSPRSRGACLPTSVVKLSRIQITRQCLAGELRVRQAVAIRYLATPPWSVHPLQTKRQREATLALRSCDSNLYVLAAHLVPSGRRHAVLVCLQ
jgi:hypothetical protein